VPRDFFPLSGCSLACPGTFLEWNRVKVKGKGFPYSILRVGPRADPGVQAVSLQVTWPYVIHPAVGCHYFPPGLQLPPQPQSITSLWPVPSYTAWWQRHTGVNNLPKVVTQHCFEKDLNPRPTDRKPKCLTRCTTAPPKTDYVIQNKCLTHFACWQGQTYMDLLYYLTNFLLMQLHPNTGKLKHTQH